MVSSESERRNWVIRCQRLPFIDFWLDAAAGSHVVGFLFSTRDGLLIKIRIRTEWPYAADCQSPLAELANSSPWTVFSNKSEEAIDGDFNVLLMLMSWTSARSCFWSEADVMQWDWPSLLDLHICSETSGRWNFPVCQLWTVCSQRHFSPATGIAHQRGSAWAINYAPVHFPAGPRPPFWPSLKWSGKNSDGSNVPRNVGLFPFYYYWLWIVVEWPVYGTFRSFQFLSSQRRSSCWRWEPTAGPRRSQLELSNNDQEDLGWHNFIRLFMKSTFIQKQNLT